MKCSECNNKNILNSNYCKKCGHKFTKKEKRKSSILSPMWWIKSGKKVYDVLTFKDSLIVKVIHVIIFLCIGLFMFITIGNELSILDSELYEVKYNSDSKIYYVFLDDDKHKNNEEVALKAHVPNYFGGLLVTHYSEGGEIISEEVHGLKDDILVTANDLENTYYVISNTSNNNEYINVYVYDKVVYKSESKNKAGE